jgi:F0F1-type ATP synthase epsilon subunit
MQCNLVSPIEQHTTEVEGVFFTTTTGQCGILKDHMPLVAELQTNSILRLKTATGERRFRMSHGSFIRFAKNEALILTQRFSEIDY